MKIKQFYFFIASMALGSLLWTACQKSDVPGVKTADNVNDEQFFTNHKSGNPVIQSIQGFVQRENEKYHFVNRVTEKIGFPHWDKCLVVEKDMPATAGVINTSSATTVFIPFVMQG